MRTSIVSAAFLLVGAGAAALAATESGGGNNLALNGSDTLFDVTQEVITACGKSGSGNFGFSDFAGDGISYLGGGSAVGAGQMGLGLQELSPMSRALKNSEYCTPGTAAAGEGASPVSTESLLVGIDGIAIVANQTNSCASAGTAAIGLGSTQFTVANAPCHGCEAGTSSYVLGSSTSAATIYQGQPSFDALAIIYFGLTHDNFWDCTGNVRKSLVANWGALFNTTCTASGGNCPNGLTHAWRRNDLSGTTDAFWNILLPNSTYTTGTAANGKGASETDASGNALTDLNCANASNVLGQCSESIGIGTVSTVPAGRAKKTNPFCNSIDANTANPTAVPPVSAALSFAGASDYSDFDPIRTKCTTADATCEAFQAANSASKFAGDLGLVLPITLPDGKSTVSGDDYPLPSCSGGCALIPIAKSAAAGATLCPNGLPSYAGSCFLPVVSATGDPDPRCISTNATTCVDTQGKRDGRTYNMITIAESASPGVGNKSAGGTYQWAFDANNHFINGSFYRIRSTSKADPTNTGSGICQQNDDTSQIGCLVDSDPCSIGFAGRESAQIFANPGGAASSTAKLKALAVNGGHGLVPPYAPIVSGGNQDADLFLENLLTTGTTVYPLSRRLYVATQYGFGSNMAGGEKELGECYGTDAITTLAITDNHFVPIPANNGHPAGVECIDYIESGTSTSSPAPNTQGPGAVAFPGCNISTLTAAGNTDACTAAATAPHNTAGALVPEAM